MSKTCKTCTHWHPGNSYSVVEEDWASGDCRRYPPKLFLTHDDEDFEDREYHVKWPDMRPEHWCGEYQPKNKADLKSDDDRLCALEEKFKAMGRGEAA